MISFKKIKTVVTPLDKVNVDTDQIVPKQFLKLVQKSGFGKFLFYNWRYDDQEQTKSDFILNNPRYKNSKILVAGDNFGCGSSREHAPIAIKAARISCVIAKSFARIFFRNAINIGLPIFECPEAAEQIREGDEIEVHLASGEILNHTSKKRFKFEPFPQEMQEIIQAGGLMNFVKKKMSVV